VRGAAAAPAAGRAIVKETPPPLLPVRPRRFRRHGRTRTDPYAWVRSAADPEVREFLRASNRHARLWMGSADGLRRRIESELRDLTPPFEGAAPFRFGRHVYHFRHPADRDYPLLVRWPTRAPQRVETLLDINTLAAGRRFLAVPAFAISPDERLLAFAMDATGGRRHQIRVLDLESGRLLADVIRNADCNFAWCRGGRALAYAALAPRNLRPATVRLRELGRPARADRILHVEQDERFRCLLMPATSGSFIRLVCFSADTEETLLLDAAAPEAPPLAVAPRRPGCVDDVDHGGGLFVLRTNRRRRDFSLFTATRRDLAAGRWRALAPPRDGVFIERMAAFRRHAVVTERCRSHQRLRIVPLAGGPSRTPLFPEDTGEAWVEPVPGFRGAVARVGYTSLLTPLTYYDCTLRDGRLRLVQQEFVPGYDRRRYETWRGWAPARDGARIPFTAVRRRDAGGGNRRPALIFAYGAYGTNIPPWFDQARLPLLDRGFLYVMAHIRGGSELGEEWHRRACRDGRMVAARDLADVAGHLAAGPADPARLFVETLSAGGIAVGAAINRWPRLFRGVIAHAPFVDPVGSMSDADLPLTLSEHAEWGDPARPAEWLAMRAISPYDNVRPRRYPAMLVTTAPRDSQVPFHEPVKWVARLRRADRGGGPILLLTHPHADHAGPSGRARRRRMQAFEWAFLLRLAGRAAKP
jgi:oligopeptidase B